MDIRSKFLAGLWGGRKGKAGPAAGGAEGERTIALEQIWSQVSAGINERDPEDWNQWHWLQDLYYDDGQLFAITISAGRLFRWPVTAESDAVRVGEPVAVVVQFADADAEDSNDGEQRVWPGDVRQTEDGRWVGCAVLCTATVNKMGILDSRALFDSFVERFQGDGSEYINLLHLGGDKSQIGVLRHIWREDKLLVGLYEFAADDAVAAAVARTLGADSDGFWGGSIEFAHYGQMQLVEVAEGVKLPMTHDGKLLGYSIARMAGPFGVLAAVRAWVENSAGAPDWLREGLACPVCVAFWVTLVVAWITSGGWLVWLSGYGMTVVVLRWVDGG